MELSSNFLLRLVGILTSVSLAHVLTRRFMALGELPDKPNPVLIVLLFALGIAGMPHSSSIAAIWALIWLAFAVGKLWEPLSPMKALRDQGRWITAWGLTLAVPVTLFSQLDLFALVLAQEGLVADLLPAWGVVYNPFAFALAVLALAGWARQAGPSLSIRHPTGMFTSLFLLVTVACFLGGWHIPWLQDTALEDSVGTGTAIALYWAVYTFKITLLWLAILWINRPRNTRLVAMDPFFLSVLSVACLVITWAVLAWREVA